MDRGSPYAKHKTVQRERGFFSTLVAILFWPIKFIVKQLLVLVIILAVSYGGLILYLDMHPDKRDKLEGIVALTERVPLIVGGIAHEAGFPELGNDLGYTPDTMQLDALPKDMVRDFCTMATKKLHLQSEEPIAVIDTDDDRIPNTLIPIMDVLAGTAHAEKARERLAIRNVGLHGQHAVDFLDKLLEKENEEIRKAALESLRLIGTPQARETIIKHQSKAGE